MITKCLTVGPLETNCYVVGCEATGRGFVVDAADEPERIVSAAEELEMEIEAIFQTHGHPDHTAALCELIAATGAEVYLHPAEVEMLNAYAETLAEMFGNICWPLLHRTYEDGEVVTVGRLAVRVLHTPGHTPGSVCLLVEETLFSGDTLFAGGVGRCDLPGGDELALEQSLMRLAGLPDTTRVLAGHGPATTIGAEKRDNPWLSTLLSNET